MGVHAVHVLQGWYSLMKNNLSAIFESHSKSSKAHFALVTSHSAAENKLMFIYHTLKSLISRAPLVRMRVKWKALIWKSKYSGGTICDAC